LSDRDLWFLMLTAEGLDEANSGAVLGIVDKLERMERAKAIDLLVSVVGEDAEDFLKRIEQLISIRDFDSLKEYMRNLVLDGDLADKIDARLKEWQLLVHRLEAAGVGDMIQIDLGVVRGLAYYTGFVFEAFEATGEGRALAGGGRYDALVKKLGGPDMPAVGFAMGDVTLVDLLNSKGLTQEYVQRPDFIAIIGGPKERDAAMADAGLLRSMGYQVDYPLKDQAFGKQFKDANQKGARFALIYGTNELAQGVVKVRDLASGAEQDFPRTDLQTIVVDLLHSGIN